MSGLEAVWSPRIARESFFEEKKEFIDTMHTLGFIESSEMMTIREQIAVTPERLAELSGQYADMAMTMLDAIDHPDHYAKGLIGLNYSKALLYLEVKDISGALELLHEIEATCQQTTDADMEAVVRTHIAVLQAKSQ